MSIEVADGRVWIYQARTFGEPPDHPLADGICWILEQLHFGNLALEKDADGDVVSVTFGRAAAPREEAVTVNEAIQHEQARTLALDIARIFATARERSIEPRFADLAEKARMTATDNAYMNTDLYYAFEFVQLIRRIREHTFLFNAPPILGRAPEQTVEALGEATRCFLLGLTRPCVSLCRLALETLLRDRVPKYELLQEIWTSKSGEVESLINVAAKKGLLTPALASDAHSVRKAGNNAIHSAAPKDEEVWDILDQTRRIAEHVCNFQPAA